MQPFASKDSRIRSGCDNRAWRSGWSVVKKRRARQKIAARCRIVAIRPAIIAVIRPLQLAGGDVAEYLPPELHSLADRQGVGMRRDFVGTGKTCRPPQNDLGPAGAIPTRPTRRRDGRTSDAP